MLSTREDLQDDKPDNLLTYPEIRARLVECEMENSHLKAEVERLKDGPTPSKEPAKNEGMHREGDLILFASESQQEAFEKSMLMQRGCDKLMQVLAEQLTRVDIDVCRWSETVHQFCRPGERLMYDWTARQLRCKASLNPESEDE